MIKITNLEITGWKAAIRGMRNPMNSWDRSDTVYRSDDSILYTTVGPNDYGLMTKLAKNGPVHAKYRRMIVVYMDVLAPLYWWKEFDTYKVGTVANSCSTMHKIAEKKFELSDFSHEHLLGYEDLTWGVQVPLASLMSTVSVLNAYRENYISEEDPEKKKKYWWQMIQLLPTSYNQLRTVMVNYEVLANIYTNRKDHKLDEWQEFCRTIETLPISEIITGRAGE